MHNTIKMCDEKLYKNMYEYISISWKLATAGILGVAVLPLS